MVIVLSMRSRGTVFLGDGLLRMGGNPLVRRQDFEALNSCQGVGASVVGYIGVSVFMVRTFPRAYGVCGSPKSVAQPSLTSARSRIDSYSGVKAGLFRFYTQESKRVVTAFGFKQLVGVASAGLLRIWGPTYL